MRVEQDKLEEKRAPEIRDGSGFTLEHLRRNYEVLLRALDDACRGSGGATPKFGSTAVIAFPRTDTPDCGVGVWCWGEGSRRATAHVRKAVGVG